jgi:hypothetical protein
MVVDYEEAEDHTHRHTCPSEVEVQNALEEVPEQN